MADLHYFLLEKNHKTGKLGVSEFTEKADADSALFDRESNRLPEVEVVLFMAWSLDDLKHTHSRFFKTLDEMVDDFRAAAGVSTNGAS
jgi:hypothetical protein